jgi:hypothetical protein
VRLSAGCAAAVPCPNNGTGGTVVARGNAGSAQRAEVEEGAIGRVEPGIAVRSRRRPGGVAGALAAMPSVAGNVGRAGGRHQRDEASA